MATGKPRSPAHWVLGWQTLSYSLASLRLQELWEAGSGL